MHFNVGPCAASAASLRLASLALLIAAVCTVGANARPRTAEPDPAQATPPSGEINLLDRSAIPSITWKMAHDVPVWKTVSLGAYSSVNMLLEALDSGDCDSQRQAAERPGLIRAAGGTRRPPPHCHLGDSAAEIIARPAFYLSRTRQELDLVVVSLIELGFPADEDVTLEDIYARADMLGFGLCPAEVGPQLRLQYLDQKIGEFLRVGMQPIATYAGEPTDFTIGNGGSGLVLIGGDARDKVALPAITKFVFVRRRAASSH
jgi:hypothetical protein